MKPFNLEEAKAGKPVCTRDDKPARIICFDRKIKNCYPLLVLITNNDNYEECYSYTADGKFNYADESDLDLFMASEKHEGWINLYRNKEHFNTLPVSLIYNSEQDAKEAIDDIDDNLQHVATIKIEWKE